MFPFEHGKMSLRFLSVSVLDFNKRATRRHGSPRFRRRHRGHAAAPSGRRKQFGKRGCGGGGSSNMLRFYTDDAPGLKISPTVVLVMSLCFIAFVTALHVFGKLYRHKSGAAV
ncbi:transport protein Sec61 subunit beta [Spatholobus suberectus]|nr:transport protein Sec61 subunit beta [Spatholobus suberectus]